MLDAQPTSTCNTTIIEAASKHKHPISKFLNQNHLTHQHLDWFNPLEWVGQRPFLLEFLNGNIQAIMLSAPEVPKSTWIRLFSTKNQTSLVQIWERMQNQTIPILKELHINRIAALGFSHWFIDLLMRSHFSLLNQIMVLEWMDKDVVNEQKITPPIEIRLMQLEDLPEIEQIDHFAFPSLWQNSLESLTNAFQQPGVATVAVQQDQIIGYQISTAVAHVGHLARLAVHPEYQGNHVGSGLVQDMIKRLLTNGIYKITVNTQINNFASLAIYKKLGFIESGGRIPVFLKDI